MMQDIRRQILLLDSLLQQLSTELWNAAELAGEEWVSSGALAAALRQAGFSVEQGLGSQPTAFRAVYGTGGPRIGFMAEYDALPGLGQDGNSHPGHGCGHNLLGAGSTVAAIILARMLHESGRAGTVVLYGTPAEETMLGKNKLLEEGWLRDADVMLAWHPQARMRCGGVSHNAMNSILFSFYGRTAHAAADPQNGRSALDGAELMNIGCNYLREHIPDGARLHYCYTHGGEKPNIVPDHAQVWYFVRARTRQLLDGITRRVIRTAEGAAYMTETRVEHSFLVKGTHTLVNDQLSRIAFDCAQQLGPLRFGENCLSLAQKLHEELTQIEPEFDTRIPVPVVGRMEYEMGSTDLSAVSHAVPTIELCVTCLAKGTPGHHWAVTAQAGSEIGLCGTRYAAQWLALMGWTLIGHPEKLKAVRNEFQERIMTEEEGKR